jgi:hypothetical protein
MPSHLDFLDSPLAELKQKAANVELRDAHCRVWNFMVQSRAKSRPGAVNR